MTEITKGLVSEVAKPAVGFLSAAIAPQIEKVRAWAIDKDTQGKLKSEVLAETMKKYLQKLSVRVSEITTITFPQAKLDIFLAYEPLHMYEPAYAEQFSSHSEQILLSHEQLSHESKEFEASQLITSSTHSFLLIDGAGMGKSTFSKYVIAKTLFKSDKIPILLELRNLDPKTELVEYLAKELDFPGAKFDRNLFYKLLELGKFFVILDGFDEIKIEDQGELAGQIRNLSLKGGSNSLLVTSRPQEALPELSKSKTLRFMSFTKEQAISLIDRYDKISKLNIGERLKKEIPNIPEKFIESPLLVSLLYRTFGINNSIAERVSTFYDEIYHALYKGHDLINKNGFARQKKSDLDFEDFRKLLRALCHLMMLGRNVSFQTSKEAIATITKASEISRIKPSSSSNFLDDLLVAVPLMQKDGNEHRFYHKTILEYFAAEYIISSPSNTELLRKILLSKISTGYFSVFSFISDINKSLYDEAITFYFASEAEKHIKAYKNNSAALTTLAFLCDADIGLWKADLVGVGGGHNQPQVRHDILTATEHSTAAWMHGTLYGEAFFLAVAWTPKYENLHNDAWEAISSELNKDISSSGAHIFDGLEKIIKIEKWTKVDSSLYSKKQETEELELIFLHSASSVVKDISEEAGMLSVKKVNDVLKVIEKQRQLEKELEVFF